MENTDNTDKRFLYKYFPFNHYSLQLLIDRNFWLGPPDMLNDPFEGDFIIENINKFHRKKFIEILLKLSRNGRYDEIFYESYVERLRFYEQEFQNRFYDYLNSIIRKSYGTTSFSKECNSLKMWSHYADSHRGFVVIFDRNKLEIAVSNKNAKLIDVEYTGLPKVQVEYTNKAINIIDTKKLLISKLPEWESEKEVRIIKEHNFESIIPRLLDFKPDCVLGIIYGSRMPWENARTLMNIIEQYEKGSDESWIDFYWSMKSNQRDALKFNKIKFDRK
jgi:hypothetical protein